LTVPGLIPGRFLFYPTFVFSKEYNMLQLLKQYKVELRNISILLLVVAALPYLPRIGAAVLSPLGLILSAAIAGSIVLAMAIKVYFRTLIIRLTK
jgi:hypothetical protein